MSATPFLEHAGVVWRVGGTDFDVDRFLDTFSFVAPDSVWRRGEDRLLRSPHHTSGFNESLCSSENFYEAMSEVRTALLDRTDALAYLSRLGVSSVVDVGLYLIPSQVSVSAELASPTCRPSRRPGSF